MAVLVLKVVDVPEAMVVLPVPELMLTAVAPVTLPMFNVFATAPVPRLTAPVVPESRVRAPVVPVVRENALAAGVLMVNAPPVVRVAPSAPRVRAVAAPPMFKVVATVLSKSKEAEPETREVVMVGLVPKTATPVPVSSVKVARRAAELLEVARADAPSVTTNLLAVKPLTVTVAPVMAPAQVKLPVAPAMEQPVAALPPKMSTVEATAPASPMQSGTPGFA